MPTSQFQPGPLSSRGVTAADSFHAGVDRQRSMMEKAALFKQQQEMNAQKIAEEAIMAPLNAAKVQSDMVKLKTELDGALQTQEFRKGAYAMLDRARQDFDYLNQIENDQARAKASREWLSRYSQLENIKELNEEIKTKNSLATQNIVGALKIATLGSAQERAFNALTEGFTPEEKGDAQRVKTGLKGRASGAAIQYKEVVGPDGVTRLVAVDPRSVGAQVVGTGESFGSGVNPTPESEARTAGAGPAGPTTMESPTTETTAQAKKTGELKADRAAALPKRKAALDKVAVTTDRLIDDIDAAIAQVSAATAGPGGVILGAFPGTSARDLQANLDSISANVGFEALAAMREASKTGGALGNVTERELDLLQATLASLKVGQSPSQLVSNLRKARNRIAENAGTARRAFETEYGEDGGSASLAWDESKEQRLRELKAKLGK